MILISTSESGLNKGTRMTFAKKNIAELAPYLPGHQPPPELKPVKLNTNENPYPPSPKALESIRNAVDGRLRLYPPAGADALRGAIASVYGVSPEQVFCGNGSDEIISLILRAFVERGEKVAFGYPTYSYYKSMAEVHDIPYELVETDAELNLDLNGFYKTGAKVVFIANPNSPTGMLLGADAIVEFARRYPGVVVVDEAYIDFGPKGASVYRHIDRLNNLLVLRTFSKSFSLCGMRAGYAFGSPDLTGSLFKTKDSYNINMLTQVAARAAVEDQEWMERNAEAVRQSRGWLAAELSALGFTVLPSAANFVFARHEKAGAEHIFKKLEERRIFVRYFKDRRIDNYLRITIGTPEELKTLVSALKEILSAP